MTPQQIFSRLDGLIGYQTGSADGGSIQGNSAVSEWARLVKEYLKGPTCRYLTDLEFDLVPDIDDTATVVSATATHLIAACGEMLTTIATDTAGWWGFTDADTDTIEIGAAALPDDIAALIHIKDVATTGVSEFYPVIFFAGAAGTAGAATYSQTGIGLDTGLVTWADGDGGNDIATDAFRAWVLYRT